MKKYLSLHDISSYTQSFHLANYVWSQVMCWNPFNKDTLGKQFVRSVDSISANIAEGFGRYSKKEKIMFYRYAFGSVTESLDWNEKAKRRNLFQDTIYKYIYSQLISLPQDLHSLIKYTEKVLEK